jgi:hypothetical protein
MVGIVPCDNKLNHAEEPTDYAHWFDWAVEMSKTHNQKRCEWCGRYVIWVNKGEREI